MPRAVEGAGSVDPQALRDRAEAAAKAAALRYNETCGGFVRCTLIGQPRCKGTPRPADCEVDPQAWEIPRWADRIELLYKWDIMEEGCVIPAHSDNCVVCLKKAEQRGVPLPDEWDRHIVELADSMSAAAGSQQSQAYLARALHPMNTRFVRYARRT